MSALSVKEEKGDEQAPISTSSVLNDRQGRFDLDELYR